MALQRPLLQGSMRSTQDEDTTTGGRLPLDTESRMRISFGALH